MLYPSLNYYTMKVGKGYMEPQLLRSNKNILLVSQHVVLCSSPFEEESNLLIRKLLEDESMLLHWMNIGRHPIVRGILFCVHIYIACEGLGIMQLGVPNPFVAWIVPRTSSSKKC